MCTVHTFVFSYIILEVIGIELFLKVYEAACCVNLNGIANKLSVFYVFRVLALAHVSFSCFVCLFVFQLFADVVFNTSRAEFSDRMLIR